MVPQPQAPFAYLCKVTPNDRYQVVIGLEVHAQLLTKSKLFSGDSAAFSSDPNTNTSPITLAHPGTLPRMNRKVIEHAVRLGLALNCDIEQHNYFARKNYFYPDLPKGYQVSQHTTPICKNGFVAINIGGTTRKIALNRIHIEEDAGKSLHEENDRYTGIDLNRAGVPLLEIVSEPNLHSGEEAFVYLTELRKLVRWLSVCDGNMEEGSMRCDANVSVRLMGETRLGTRVEVKNLNSIRNVKRAIEFEASRLIDLLGNGQHILQETRSFDAGAGTTFSLRSKEDADDYRYFPEPDLTPFHITDEFLQKIKNDMPELPAKMQERFTGELHLSEYDASVLCGEREQAEYFEKIIGYTINVKAAANWMMGPVRNYLNENKANISSLQLPPEKIAALISLVDQGKLSFGTASSSIFSALLAYPNKDPMTLAASLDLLQETGSSSIGEWIDTVINAMPAKVAEYKKGKKGLLALFAGEVKKLSKGRADLQTVNRLLEQKLNN